MAEDPKAALHGALEHWSRTITDLAEMKLRIHFTRAYLSTSKKIDSFSSWAMLGSAGAAVATVSNLEEVRTLVGEAHLRAALLFLSISLLAGLLEKVVSTFIDICVTAEVKGEKAATQVHEEHTEEEDEIRKMASEHNIQVDTKVNLERVYASYLEQFPSVLRWFIARSMIKSKADPKYMHKKLIRAFLRQIAYMFSQVALSITALFIVAVGL